MSQRSLDPNRICETEPLDAELVAVGEELREWTQVSAILPTRAPLRSDKRPKVKLLRSALRLVIANHREMAGIDHELLCASITGHCRLQRNVRVVKVAVKQPCIDASVNRDRQRGYPLRIGRISHSVLNWCVHRSLRAGR